MRSLNYRCNNIKNNKWWIMDFFNVLNKENGANFYISLIDRIFRGEIMYEYYKQIEECETAIAKYVYGTDDISYEQAKALQKMYNVKEIITLYEECNDWNEAIELYNGSKCFM